MNIGAKPLRGDLVRLELLLMTYAFETLNVVRVDFRTDARDQPSRQAIERLGARFEGVLRNWGPSWVPGEEGRLRDSAVFSVIAVEWPQVKSALTRRIQRLCHRKLLFTRESFSRPDSGVNGADLKLEAVVPLNVRPGSYSCDMTMAAEIHPDTPFSLAAAAAFGFGPRTGRPKPSADEMRLAFVTDDMRHHAGVHLVQRPDGTITAALDSAADSGAVLSQVRRILSLDHPGAGWVAAGERDPVLGGLQREHDWLRPVLFHSPYEAAAWSIISARRYRAQAAAVRTRICAAAGAMVAVAGEQVPAFPLPADLLAADTLPGMSQDRVARLHDVARAALDGRLDPTRLAAMEPEEALRDLRRLPGIGPFYATLILLRSTGTADVLTFGEPRLPSYVAYFYGTGPAPASSEELARVAENWRPFRTWAAVLIRAAGDRAGLASLAAAA